MWGCKEKTLLGYENMLQQTPDSIQLAVMVSGILYSPEQWENCAVKDSVCSRFESPAMAARFPDLTLNAFANYFRCTRYLDKKRIQQFIDIAGKTGNDKLKSYAIYFQARSDDTDMELSIQRFLEAQRRFEERKDTNGLMLVTRWLGRMYQLSELHDSALVYARLSYRYSKYQNDSIEEFVRMMELSERFENTGKLDSAFYYYQLARPYSHVMSWDMVRTRCYLELDLLSTDKSRSNQDSLNYYTSAYIDTCLLYKDWPNLIFLYSFYAKGLNHARNFQEAKKYLDKGLAYTDSCPACIKEFRDIYYAGYLYHNSVKNYALALNNLELYNKYNEQYESEKTIQDMGKQKELFEFRQQNQVLELKQQHTEARLNTQRQQKYYFIAGCFLLLAIAGLVFHNYRNQKVAKEQANTLLLNILPSEVADELKEKGYADARLFDNVTVFFSDFKSFTTISEKLSPQQLVDELHDCFSAFDNIMHKHNIEKIKTVGDAYLAVSGLPLANPNHAEDAVKAALEIQQFMADRKKQKGNHEGLYDIRVGINSGSVVAGIVGVKKFAYDIWGDTVNTAARMEQNGEAGKINISESTYELVKDKFTCEYRGEIEAKNKGKLKMYFVD